MMSPQAKRSVHLWIVGGFSLLWNAFGAFNYWVTQTRSPTVMAQLSKEQRAFIDNAPIWVDASWAFGVWGALAGSILLLMRSRFAVSAFILSLLGLAANSFYQLSLPEPSPHLNTSGQVALHLFIWAIAIGLLVYSIWVRRQGTLR